MLRCGVVCACCAFEGVGPVGVTGVGPGPENRSKNWAHNMNPRIGNDDSTMYRSNNIYS